MGRRGRQRLPNAVMRASKVHAAREQAARVDDSRVIAQRVYTAAEELRADGAEPLPLPILAPLIVAAETAAPGACKIAGLDVTEKNAQEVAAYLVAGFREMVVMLSVEHLRKWQEMTDPEDAGDAPAS